MPIEKNANNSGINLFEAARTGRHNDLLAVLATGVNVDVRCPHGWTALHHAAATGQQFILKVLIQRGASLLAETPDGLSAHHLAKLHGYSACADYIDYLDNAEYERATGFTEAEPTPTANQLQNRLLCAAIRSGNDAEVARLAAQVFSERADQPNPLRVAVEVGNFALVRQLTASGFYPWFGGVAASTLAERCNRPDMAAYLRSIEAEIWSAEQQQTARTITGAYAWSVHNELLALFFPLPLPDFFGKPGDFLFALRGLAATRGTLFETISRTGVKGWAVFHPETSEYKHFYWVVAPVLRARGVRCEVVVGDGWVRGAKLGYDSGMALNYTFKPALAQLCKFVGCPLPE